MDLLWNKVEEAVRNLSIQQKYAFISAVIAGVFSHGYAMGNNYIYHDATILNGLGTTFGLGRWALGYAGLVNDMILGNYNLPFFNVAVSILLIAVSAMVTVDVLKVSGKFLSVFIGAAFSVYPVVTSTFAYNFSAVFYFIALLLAVLCVKKVSDGKLVCGVILLVLSAGIYQAYLSVAVTLALTLIMIELIDSDTEVKNIINNGIKFIITFIVSLVLYLIINKISFAIMKPPATGYQGADDMGALSIAKIPGRIIQTYLHFFYIKWNGINKAVFMWVLIMVFLVVAFICIVTGMVQTGLKTAKVALFVVSVAVMPIAVNLVYLMSTNDNYSVHTLMRFATVFVLITPAVLMEKIMPDMWFKGGMLGCLASVILTAIIVCYIYSNNIAYLKMNLVQEEMNSFFTVMQSRIVETEGFKDDMPVCFIGEFNIVDNNLYDINEMYNNTVILGYEYNARDLINRESWKRYMAYHTGFAPNIIDAPGDTLSSEELASMNAYPSADSIRIIDGIVTVKLAE